MNQANPGRHPGYASTRTQPTPTARSGSGSARAARSGAAPAKPAAPALRDLLLQWQDRTRLLTGTSRDGAELAATLLARGEPLLAFDLLQELRATFPRDARLRQLLGLALARAGSTAAAQSVLEQLLLDGHQDEETIGLLARTCKDRWQQSPDHAAGRAALLRACQLYQSGFEMNPGAYWTGINAATLHLLAGHARLARSLARKVLAMAEQSRADLDRHCARIATGPRHGSGNRSRPAAPPHPAPPSSPATDDPNRYWVLATLGEAHLVLGDLDRARTAYGEARTLVGHRWADLASTRRNARLLAEHQRLPWDEFADAFRIPPVVVFTGHMLDRPDRPQPRFPVQAIAAVRREITRRLDRCGAGFVYAAAANGSDLLLLDAAVRRGLETHVVLPTDPDRFRLTSVEPFGMPPDPAEPARCRDRHRSDDAAPGRPSSRPRPTERPTERRVSSWCGPLAFDRLLQRVDSVTVAAEGGDGNDPELLSFTGRLMHGLALTRANRLGTDLQPMAVWDGRPGDGGGGTAWMIDFWRSRGYPVEVIRLAAGGTVELGRGRMPDGATGAVTAPTSTPINDPRTAAPAADRGPGPGRAMPRRSPAASPMFGTCATRAMLFADAVHFSHLSEPQLPAFIEAFLGTIGKVVAETGSAVRFRNTWGDGLFFVFDDIVTAGRFALELAHRTSATDWTTFGLPQRLGLRIALHAGPVRPFTDPVTGRENFLGTHVNRAARIEPITPPGEVYTTEFFAALAVAEGVRDFRCDYVGRVPLAKSFGTFPLFHLRASG